MFIKRLAADSWFSRCVREAAKWKCQRCGAQHDPGSQGLHCAHFMTRGKWATRFDPLNVAALCYGCHSFIDSRPYEKAQLRNTTKPNMSESSRQTSTGCRMSPWLVSYEPETVPKMQSECRRTGDRGQGRAGRDQTLQTLAERMGLF